MTYRESQQSVSAWALETFGPPKTIYSKITRANLEWAEFLQSYNIGQPDPVELADTAIVLLHTGVEFDVPLNHIVYAPRGYSGCQDVHRVALSMHRLVDASLAGSHVGIKSHLPWVMDGLCDIAYDLGHEMAQLIDDKMVINRNRQWNLDKSGHGYHKHLPEVLHA